MTRFAAYCALPLVVLGCQQILGIEEGAPRGQGGQGAAASGEKCSNGEDDDADGLVDCEDADCEQEGYACMPRVDGWSGPVIVATGESAAALPVCPVEWEKEVLGGATNPTAPQAECGCSCAELTGVVCTLNGGTIELHEDVNCTGLVTSTTTVPQLDTCFSLSAGQLLSFTGVAPVVSGGSCTAVTTVVRPPVVYDGVLIGCEAPNGAGCADTGACALPRPGGFEYCVYRDGSVDCPPEYPNQTFVVDESNTDDMRACDRCTACTIPSGEPCDANTSVYSNSGCNSINLLGTATGDSCANTRLDNGVSAFVSTNMTTSATCTPGTSTPTGQVDFGGTTTVCCAP